MDFQEKANPKALQDSDISQIARTKSLIEQLNQLIANKEAQLQEPEAKRAMELTLKNLKKHRSELEEELRIAIGSDNEELVEESTNKTTDSATPVHSPSESNIALTKSVSTN